VNTVVIFVQTALTAMKPNVENSEKHLISIVQTQY